ncbi:hypothetical protein Glove_144g162 [Diversispora epigaea]|uniref:Uncharacterized protein n=1 Tax=Diversispora epigaea TaxID=1348612 RepID=A0A397J3B7_9GLOM|nr:hypothetical protein Glove_144g162 [Diversispora epigaea]
MREIEAEKTVFSNNNIDQNSIKEELESFQKGYLLLQIKCAKHVSTEIQTSIFDDSSDSNSESSEGGLLVEAEKICNAYFVGGNARNRSRKNSVFVGGESSLGNQLVSTEIQTSIFDDSSDSNSESSEGNEDDNSDDDVMNDMNEMFSDNDARYYYDLSSCKKTYKNSDNLISAY